MNGTGKNWDQHGYVCVYEFRRAARENLPEPVLPNPRQDWEGVCTRPFLPLENPPLPAWKGGRVS